VHVLRNYLVFDTVKTGWWYWKSYITTYYKSCWNKLAADRFTCSKTKQDRRLEAKSVGQETSEGKT
jgi:hypothetical protein